MNDEYILYVNNIWLIKSDKEAVYILYMTYFGKYKLFCDNVYFTMIIVQCIM